MVARTPLLFMDGSDFSFLRTGFDASGRSGEGLAALDPHARRTLLALLQLFLEDAVCASARYVRAKGRDAVDARDMKRALQFQARQFFAQPRLEERVRELVEQDSDASGETGESDDDDDEDEDEQGASHAEGSGDEDDSEGDEHGVDASGVTFLDDATFCRAVDASCATWDEWEPTDDMQATVKRAIDAVSMPPPPPP